MNKIVKLFAGIIALASIATISACKKNYDNPPGPSDNVNLVANTTIETLKAIHTTSGAYDVISSDIIISGIVTANDKSGNLYKQIFIQDTTGAMQVMIEASSVYGTFPVGRRVFIRCQGLCLTDYHGTMQLGMLTHDQAGIPDVQGILFSDVSKYIIGGSINNPVVPIPVTPADLGTTMQSRYINALVQLDDFEFDDADTSKTYSDTSAYKNTENRNIANCSGTTLIVRNSGYANFAALPIPKGHGSIASIYTIYKSTPTSSNTDKQLLLRDTSDVHFYALRCGAAPTNALLFETFEAYPASSTSPYVQVSIPGWTNASEIGTYTYTNRTYSGNNYAYTSPFGVTTAKTWLVTKGVSLDATAGETLSFDTKQDFLLSTYPGGTNVASDMKIMVSTDYTGAGSPWTNGTWTDITSQALLSPGSTSSAFPTAYTNSGLLDISTYSGTIYVAFINSGGTSVNKTSSWEIDNIEILGN